MTAVDKIRNLVVGFSIVFLAISLIKIYFTFFDRNTYLIMLSLTSSITTFLIVRFMFAPTRIKGKEKDYVVAPDLSIVRTIDHEKMIVPEEGPCSFCSKIVYKPFLCDDCKQFFCGTHILPSDHDCNPLHKNKNRKQDLK